MARNIPLPMPPKRELEDYYFRQKLSYSQLGEIYHVSPSTLTKWFKIYGIPARVSTKVKLKVIGKVTHRMCYGPTHPAGGAWVPVTKFHKHRSRPHGIRNRCAECNGDADTLRVPLTPNFQGWLTSIVRRIGPSEAARRLEISHTTLTTWLGNSKSKPAPKSIRRENAQSIVKLIAELKVTDEVRHRKSIRRGSAIRGEAERPVKSNSDLYHRGSNGDDAEYKRRQRQDPEFRAAENKRRRDYLRRKRERLTDTP